MDPVQCVTLEESAIKSLRDLIPDDVISINERFKSDFYLLQWLKTEKFNQEKTEVVIRKSLQWRAEVEVASDWNSLDFLEFKETFEFSTGVDKHNCPVVYMQVGKRDYRKGMCFYGKKIWVKYWAKYYGILEEFLFTFNNKMIVDATQITNASAKEMIIIADVKDFSAYQMASFDAVRVLLENITNLRNYFPSLFRLCFFINENTFFKIVLKTIKPIITVPYLTFEVYGSDKREWRDRVLQIMDEKLCEFLEF